MNIKKTIAVIISSVMTIICLSFLINHKSFFISMVHAANTEILEPAITLNDVQSGMNVTTFQTTSKATTTSTTKKTTTFTKITTKGTTTTSWTPIEVEAANVILINGDQYTINTNQKYVKYETNNSDVAVVSKNGLITAVGIGQATISVIASNSNVAQVKVDVLPFGIPLQITSTKQIITTTHTTTTITAPNTTTSISDTQKTTKALITTTVTATTAPRPPVEINETSLTLINGDRYTIKANRNDVTYKTNNSYVAIVSNRGVISAVGVGQATISVIDSNSNVAQVKLDVLPSGVPLQTTNTNPPITTTQTKVMTTKYITTLSATLKGDANCDGLLDMSDAVLIMQALANPNKYGIDGTAEYHLTLDGKGNGDMDGDGLTVGDAQVIQRKLLGLE